MGSFKKIKCLVCGASIEVWKIEEIPERCPACKEYMGDSLAKQGGGTGLDQGLTTANTYFSNERINTNQRPVSSPTRETRATKPLRTRYRD